MKVFQSLHQQFIKDYPLDQLPNSYILQDFLPERRTAHYFSDQIPQYEYNICPDDWMKILEVRWSFAFLAKMRE